MLDLSNRTSAFFVDAEVLVTGGFGFIGSHLASALVDAGARVTLLDLDTSPRRASLINLRPGLRAAVRSIECDLSERLDRVAGSILSRPFAAIFNCASFASVVERAVDFPYETVRTNTVGLLNLLESVRTASVRPASIVHTSTDKVYGNASGGSYDEESSPLRAIGVYDVSKLAADALARMYHDVFDLPTVVMRLCNVFGPHDYNTGFRVVPKAMKALLGEDDPRPPSLYEGSILHERDYIYIDDCVCALMGVAAAPKCRGKVYNLMGCRHLKTVDMIEAAIRAAAEATRDGDPLRSAAIEENGYSVVRQVASGVVTIPAQHASGARLRRDLAFEPLTSLEDGLLLAAEAYRDYFAAAGGAPALAAELGSAVPGASDEALAPARS